MQEKYPDEKTRRTAGTTTGERKEEFYRNTGLYQKTASFPVKENSVIQSSYRNLDTRMYKTREKPHKTA